MKIEVSGSICQSDGSAESDESGSTPKCHGSATLVKTEGKPGEHYQENFIPEMSAPVLPVRTLDPESGTGGGGIRIRDKHPRLIFREL
jgi:hypothetical protein